MTASEQLYAEQFDTFLAAHPEYLSAPTIEDIRAEEYPQLAQDSLVYLDYTGSGLFSLQQIRAHHQWLAAHVYGNPHSGSEPALRATTGMEETRQAVLEFFRADPAEYVAIFTANATGALHLIGESFPFTPDSELLFTADNHNSVLGLREFARRGHSRVRHVSLHQPCLRADEDAWKTALNDVQGQGPHLFAYPAQSNFTGVQHDFGWIGYAQERGWRVILDAAAYVPTSRLDLSTVHPDFVPVSFYKMFGYPSGLGCLLARREALALLSRPWFSGGTVLASSLEADAYAMLPAPAGFEDGTPDFLNIPAVAIGLRQLDRLGLEAIHARTQALLAWTLESLQTLQHTNGRPLIEILGPKDAHAHGPTLALRVLDPGGQPVDERLVIQEANAHHIVLRAGCFCNPGAGETALGFPPTRLHDAFAHAGTWHSIDELVEFLDIPTLGVVRLSFGLVSTFEDALAVVQFFSGLIDRPANHDPLPPRSGC